MMPSFSYLKSDSDFPNVDNVNVYKYDNDFDYSRYNYEQMDLMLCDVPWDVGEAHVGQRTLSGIGNVVYFGSPQERDAWFDAIPDAQPGEDPKGKCLKFSTKFKELHREQSIDLPIPYDVAALFNYLVVRYKPFANENSYVEYETGLGKLDWFWFVREVEFVAPNTTRLHLLDDAFQTWIYDVNVSGMVLERGHAPMFATRADAYLQNPIANNVGLLCEDVSYGQPANVAHTDALVLNAGEMWACIATSADVSGSWGAKSNDSWKVPTSAFYSENGVPSFYVFAIEPSQLSTFLSTIQLSYPQFAQTVQGVFFAPKNLVNVSRSFTFADTNCNVLSSSRQTMDLTKLDKSLFAYDPKYADLAKLYTSPYAHIEITDETGNIDVIRIEDTTGDLNVSSALSLAYPFVNIEAHLLGAGGQTTSNITFRNISAQTFDISGMWYETLREWQIPVFAIVQSPQANFDYSTHFDRKQQVTDYQTQYANAQASALTDKTNAETMAQSAKSNADANADTDVANTSIQVAGNTAVNSTSNASALSDTNLANLLSQASQAYEAGYARETTNNEINAEYASAAIGVGGGIAGSVVSGLASGGPIGAVSGLISGAISGATSMAQTSVSANLKSDQAEATIGLSQSKVSSTNTNNTERTTNQNSANASNTATTNSASTGVTANNAATMKGNATRTQNATNATALASYTTNVENAGRDQSRAQSAIDNSIKQAALNSPLIYGIFKHGETAATKPMALFSNIVTQPKSAIAAAGDEFLRYGYMYDMQWPFDGNWNIGKYFTYWKLKDFWVSDLQVPDLYMDKLRFFLFGGVTIWSKPEYIGKVSIYDNFNE